MKTDTDKQGKQLSLSTRDAAIEFIRPYVEEGDAMPLLPGNKLRIETEFYSAHIDRKTVVVTKLNGGEVNEIFSLKDIMKEITESSSKLFHFSNTASAAYREKGREVNVLIDQLMEKLKKHRERFRGKPNDWSFVGDLSHIAEVLAGIA
ncbi:hypothetical protein JYU16_01150 [bacterium AH-315-M05]|nr:hypothetical protein [bacterium AH-315-M05]